MIEGMFTSVVREGNRVLKRTSIRMKLVIALTSLSVIFCSLVAAIVFVLSSYKSLAIAVTQHSVDVRNASELISTADDLSRSFESKIAALEPTGLLTSELKDNPLHNLAAHGSMFTELLAAFSNKLEACCNLSSSQSTELLLPASDRELALADIQAEFDYLKELQAVEIAYFTDVDRQRQIRESLDDLVDKTENHATDIHERFTQYSRQVRIQARTWRTVAWVCLAATIVFAVGLFWTFTSYITKPFRTLIGGSRLVAGGEFDHRIDLGTDDELNELAQAMNGMTARFQSTLGKLDATCKGLDRQVQERSREVIQNEQLAGVGFLAAGVAHEINNPLAAIAWSSESLQSRLSELGMLPTDQRVIDEELQKDLTVNLRRIEDEAYRCKRITEKLLDFSRLSEVRRASTDIVELVHDVVAMVSNLGEFRCKKLTTRGENEVIAEVNPQEIRQVVLNLITNALESVDADGSVNIYVGTQGDSASVIVEDDGCGMNDEVQEHLFEPFFTRRRDGTGTGLGLSITYRIVSKHGGSLQAMSEGEGRGSKMEMLLPCAATEDEQTGSRVTIGLEHESYQKIS